MDQEVLCYIVRLRYIHGNIKRFEKTLILMFFFNIMQLLRNVIKPGFHRERPMDKFLARSGFLHLTD